MIVTRLLALTLSLGSVIHVLAAPVAAPQLAQRAVSNPSTDAAPEDPAFNAAVKSLETKTKASIDAINKKIDAASSKKDQKALEAAAKELEAAKTKFISEAEALDKKLPSVKGKRAAGAIVTGIKTVGKKLVEQVAWGVAVETIMSLFKSSEDKVQKAADPKQPEGKKATQAVVDPAGQRRGRELIDEAAARNKFVQNAKKKAAAAGKDDAKKANEAPKTGKDAPKTGKDASKTAKETPKKAKEDPKKAKTA